MLHGHADGVWQQLLTSRRVAPDAGRAGVEAVVAAMQDDDDPVVRLIGTSLALRLTSFDRLTAARAAVRGGTS